MASGNFKDINFTKFKWFNEPKTWHVDANELTFVTENQTDFWQGTWYNFYPNSGHVFGVDIKDDFTLSVCVEAEFHTLYDQAGLMIYWNEKHWLKTGIEFNDGQPMIGSVHTNEVSDWATGVFPGNCRKFYIRLTKKRGVVCVKYSTDNITWTLLRLASVPNSDDFIVGPMACTPTREGLTAKFTELTITEPADDILHSN